uniref:Calmodulin-lysine N-methyltransferase n=1 Tax=Stomoxys calcitrans TaxID=35570 RepID=A0A1I8PJ52_STOCA
MSTPSVQNPSAVCQANTDFNSTQNKQQAQPEPQQQLSSISIMWDYDIDNTLNTIKENGSTNIFKGSAATPTPSPSPPLNSSIERQQQQESSKMGIAKATPHASAIMDTNSSPEKLQPLSVKCDDIKAILPLTPPATPVTQNTARKRWRILAKVLRKDSEETVSSSGEECTPEQNTASVRRFKSFDLLRQDSFEDHGTLNYLGKAENWYKYKVILDGSTNGQQEYTVNIHHMERHLTASDLMGFNNTGNICVWPSEEALTAFVLSDLASYNGKWILELGGGFTCLSGLMLSKYAKPYAVHLTDGNEVSVENVKKTVCLNEMACYTKCSVLKWQDKASRSPSEAGKFDVILSADCLFFDEARSSLVDTIWYYLSPKGEALVMAPRRGKTMSLFIDEAVKQGFQVALTQRYNETIWRRHLELMNSSLYDADLHYPVLLRLRKPSTMVVPMDVCKEEEESLGDI